MGYSPIDQSSLCGIDLDLLQRHRALVAVSSIHKSSSGQILMTKMLAQQPLLLILIHMDNPALMILIICDKKKIKRDRGKSPQRS